MNHQWNHLPNRDNNQNYQPKTNNTNNMNGQIPMFNHQYQMNAYHNHHQMPFNSHASSNLIGYSSAPVFNPNLMPTHQNFFNPAQPPPNFVPHQHYPQQQFMQPPHFYPVQSNPQFPYNKNNNFQSSYRTNSYSTSRNNEFNTKRTYERRSESDHSKRPVKRSRSPPHHRHSRSNYYSNSRRSHDRNIRRKRDDSPRAKTSRRSSSDSSSSSSSSDEEDDTNSSKGEQENITYTIQSTQIPVYYSKEESNSQVIKSTNRLDELCAKFDSSLVKRSSKIREKQNIPAELTKIPDYRQLLRTQKFDKFTRCKCDHANNSKSSCTHTHHYHKNGRVSRKKIKKKLDDSITSSSKSSSSSRSSSSSSFSSESSSYSTSSSNSGKSSKKEKSLEENEELDDIRSMEIDRKQKHPERLHTDLTFNEPDQTNEGPLCKCKLKNTTFGTRHQIYYGEQVTS